MSVIVSTFPSFNSFNSRSWTIAAIIALHAGFFWILSSGGISVIATPPPPPFTVLQLDENKPPPTARPVVIDNEITPTTQTIIPPQPRYLFPEPETSVIRGEEWTAPPPPVEIIRGTPEPVLVQPAVDPRFGLSEPAYPSSERRLGHEGTVILAIEVLANGRVGQVRVEKSSGYERLDEAAVRQTSRWRLRAGTRDGVPLPMWKRIPVHFRLTQPAQSF